MTADVCRENKFKINEDEFEQEMNLQKDRGRESGKFNQKKILDYDGKSTLFVGYEQTQSEIIIQGLFKNEKPINILKKNDEGIIERRNLLEKKGLNKAFIEENLEARDSFYKKDDFIDACSLFWSASRVALNKEIRIPDKIFTDADGIIMQIRV